MVIVIVEHFLSTKGQNYFPRWLSDTATILKNSEGFVSIDFIEKVGACGTCLLLKFDSLENLRTWSGSEEHSQALDRLSQYQVKKQISQIYKIGKWRIAGT